MATSYFPTYETGTFGMSIPAVLLLSSAVHSCLTSGVSGYIDPNYIRK